MAKSKRFCVIEYAQKQAHGGFYVDDLNQGCFHRKVNALRKCQAIRRKGGRCFVMANPARGSSYAVTDLKGRGVRSSQEARRDR